MDDIVYRKARSEDLQKLVELEESCFKLRWNEGALKSEIRDHKSKCYVVAEKDGEILAYGGLWIILDEGHINRICVLPRYRNMHIGRGLVVALMEESKKEGCRSFTLECRASNEHAIRLYLSLGFKKDGVRKRYYEDDEDAVIMWYHMDETQTE